MRRSCAMAATDELHPRFQPMRLARFSIPSSVQSVTDFLILIGCVFLGVVVNVATGIPLPGSVIGLLILLLVLILKGGPSSGLRSLSSVLLHNMSVLFVPAGVGLMTQLPALQRDLWPILVAITVSTTLGMAVTAVIMHLLTKRAPHEH